MTDADAVWVDELDTDVCWKLLAGHSVGRIAFVLDDEPMVLPVNYAVDGHAIVFRTGQSSILEALADGGAAAFEIDGADPGVETGWSVLARGEAREIDGSDRLRVEALPLHPWAPGPKERWLRFVPDVVTGRAISRRREAPDGDLLPYMPPD
jgi:nitroimidazol reductase NimA-like FMN-containing flavoprotein (pyridoxamine 5'-phosphate oxidase superfamily)